MGPQTSNCGKPPLFISRPNDLRAVQTVERVEKKTAAETPPGTGLRREWPGKEVLGEGGVSGARGDATGDSGEW